LFEVPSLPITILRKITKPAKEQEVIFWDLASWLQNNLGTARINLED
jgi:hypothetical protein